MITRDLNIIRALNYASGGAARWQMKVGHKYHYENVTVTRAIPRLGYGYSLNQNAILQHKVAKLFLAWRRGKLVGQLVRWSCGITSTNFAMTKDPVKLRVPCKRCAVAEPNAIEVEIR